MIPLGGMECDKETNKCGGLGFEIYVGDEQGASREVGVVFHEGERCSLEEGHRG